MTEADVMLSASLEQPSQNRQVPSYQVKAETNDNDDDDGEDDVLIQQSIVDSAPQDVVARHQQQPAAGSFPTVITVGTVTVTNSDQPITTMNLQDRNSDASANAADVFCHRCVPAAASSAMAGKNVTPVKCTSHALIYFVFLPL